MDTGPFTLSLFLPAQGAAESEATIIEWCVAEGDSFTKGQILAQVDSAKSVFDFEAPCDGQVIGILHREGDSVSYEQPVVEIETSDPDMKQWIPAASAGPEVRPVATIAAASQGQQNVTRQAVLAGIGGYLPKRVVSNAELLEHFPGITEKYIYQVTGIRQRRWADEKEKPSDMAYAAALEAIRKAGVPTKEIDAIVLATTTPDMAMPSTACILQDRLNMGGIPAFDLNAACSGWLYAVSMARCMIMSGMSNNVLTVGVDVQSKLLDRKDQNTAFIFGDGAGAAVISAAGNGRSDNHMIREVVLAADSKGLHMARREQVGYVVANGHDNSDPWIRMDGQALFRFATESFADIIKQVIAKTGWSPDEARWVIPHQANRRILAAAAKRSDVSFDRFYLNVERVGNTSSASIPLAMLEIEESLKPGDKLILCSVGAGVTTAAISVEW